MNVLQCLNEQAEIGVYSSPIQGQGFEGSDQGFIELLSGRVMKRDPDVDNGWVFSYGSRLEFEMSSTVPMASKFPPEALGMETFKKREADRIDEFKVVEDQYQEKRTKGNAQEFSIKTSSKSSVTTSKKESSAVPKPDYIHVRARRGQATDSHSLAERVRREKISERMKYLQELVPGCNKIIGKAGLLDEIINYVQSLQRQVEFLSMKLAVINPRLDFDPDSLLAKKMLPACVSDIPGFGLSPDALIPSQFEINSLSQGVSFSGFEADLHRSDDTLQRTLSAPVPTHMTLLDASCLNQIQCSNWDDELQNLYGLENGQGRSASYISQPFTGLVKHEMQTPR